MNYWKCYEKGNHEYLSPEHLKLLKHTVNEAKRLDMEVSVTFSPGWSFGGDWVPKEDQSKALLMAVFEVKGPARIDGPVVKPDLKPIFKEEIYRTSEICSIVAVVASKLTDDRTIIPETLTVIAANITNGRLVWDVPEGNWRIMAFYLVYTGQVCQANNFEPEPKVIDHLNKGAVERYCKHLTGVFKEVVGDAFGDTVDSFFCDSFEVMPPPNGILWSSNTLDEFKRIMGYDLTQYLPAIWYDVPGISEHIRYDVNYCLHVIGLDALFGPFNTECNKHGVQARVQPHYRFTTEIVQASGAIPRPETEVTTKKFDTIADPRKATASGCRFYGKSHVSAEAYTFIRKYRYRTDLMDLKIASDAFFRDGVTQLYNHGYFASAEKLVDPTRDFIVANHINHQNVWWKYYHLIASYIARCCFMLRQGRFVADILIYSPQATMWTRRVLWGGQRRVMPYGDLPITLVANGYDYDIINDDLLQNKSEMTDGRIVINGYSYRVILLPAIKAIPVETLKVLQNFVKSEGILIALQDLPEMCPGMVNLTEKNNMLKVIVRDIFESKKYSAFFLPQYRIIESVFDPEDQEEKPIKPLEGERLELINLLKKYVAPDMAIGNYKQSEGLTFIHTRYHEVDVYFITNLQSREFHGDVSLNVKGKVPQKWEPITGKISCIKYWSGESGRTVIPMSLNPWESAFYIFTPDETDLIPSEKPRESNTKKLPEQIDITGTWHVKLESDYFGSYEYDTEELLSWTCNQKTKYFSGTGLYEKDIIIPQEYINDETRIILDLGKVGMLAEVMVNGKNAGVVFMPPYKVDITDLVEQGTNRLTVKITNVLFNYINSLEGPTPIPKELQDRFGERGTKIEEFKKKNYTRFLRFLYQEIEMTDAELPQSGLMGPVRIIPE
jgi:hypothetical protein